MKINEIFYSIQGEGKLAGVPSAFIRTTGCNLRCAWCDSPATSWNPQGHEMSAQEIVEEISQYPTNHVVLTGGEPLIAPGVESLTAALKHKNYHITIETAATVWKDVTCDLASISPKLGNSTPIGRASESWINRHESARLNLDVIRRFMNFSDYQIKFVVSQPQDIVEIDQLLSQIAIDTPSNVLLMPEGSTAAELHAKAQWLAETCKQRGYRYCPRLHIELYGHKPGT